MSNFLERVLHPEWYHGHRARAPFFEGWYYKLVNAAQDERWAIIPGVFINTDPSKNHAFIQVLDGNNGTSSYHRPGTFSAEQDAFDVSIGESRFTLDHIQLNLQDEQRSIQGELSFSGLNPWPVTFARPGYMGPYAWLPFMETYHGVLSFDHAIEGHLTIDGKDIDFTGGRGYLEKDWGQAFPECYIWQQSNHFPTEGTCITASIAKVPNVGRTFAGFGVGLWHEGQLYPFTSYNRSRVLQLSVDDQNVDWHLHNADYELRMSARRAEGGLLKGPERTDMSKRVDETLQAMIHVELYELVGRSKRLIYEGQGQNAGLEVVGDIAPLLKA